MEAGASRSASTALAWCGPAVRSSSGPWHCEQAGYVRRREFVGFVPCALVASSATVPLPQFPTLAHQLVWRNWDLVAADRIARALSCNVVTVHRLARSMGLSTQTLDQRFAP